MKEKIVILTGPTGVGKTKLSIGLAKAINGEIISCDAYQIYKDMDIGTDKILPEEMDGVVHHNLDIVMPNEEFNTFKFREVTKGLITEITNRNRVPILVGGTGLYLHSIIHDMNYGEIDYNPDIKNAIIEKVKKEGLDSLFNELVNADPDIDMYLDSKNTHRVMRAYEIYKLTGNSPSKYLSDFRSKNRAYDYLYFVLNNEREVLYSNINARVDEMMGKGLLNELNGLLRKGYNFDMQSLKGIGYKEFKPYFEGEISLDDAVEKVKQHSRNFAKRQITWFKREEDAIWINKFEFKSEDEILEYIVNKVKESFK